MQSIASETTAAYSKSGFVRKKASRPKHAITVRFEPDGRQLSVDGRAARLLRHLIEVGRRGSTPLEHPAGIRISHYVFLLRRYSVLIETEHQSHVGPFPGVHARYWLASELSIIEDSSVAA